MSTDSNTSQQELSSTAKRGVLFITSAKIWFLISGLILQLLLPRALGSPQEFGMWGLVVAWMSGISNVLVMGTIQTIARFSQPGMQAATSAKATGLRLQMLVGGAAALIFFAAAPSIAKFGHDSTYTLPLRISSIILLCYSVYAVFVGSANGLRQFQKQAGLDMLFATFRVALVLGAAWVFHKTTASVFGFASAAILITLISILWVGWPERFLAKNSISMASMAKYLGWVILFLLPFNLTMFVDSYLLKRLCTQSLQVLSTWTPENIKKSVDSILGFYGAAQNIARLPYQLMIAATFVIFPLLSQASLNKNTETTRHYIKITLKYTLIAIVAMGVGLGVRPQATLRLLFPSEYAIGATAFALLLLVYVCYALISIVATVLNSLGHQKTTVLLSFGTLFATTGAVYLGLTQGGDPTNPSLPLQAAAQGMLVGVGLGLAGFLVFLWKRLRVSFSARGILRVALAAAPSLALGWLWKAPGSHGWMAGKAGTLLCGVISVGLYLGILMLLKELSLKEILQTRQEAKISPMSTNSTDGVSHSPPKTPPTPSAALT